MMLSEIRAGAGGVEIAEGDKIQSVNLFIPQEHFFEHQLGLAVGIDRALRQILGHRHTIRRAIGGARGTEYELLHLGGHRGVQELQPIGDVIVEILAGVGHGLADKCAGGEMQDSLRLHLHDGLLDVSLLVGIAGNEAGAAIHSRAMALAQIVINCHRVACIQQLFGANRTNIPCPTSNENVHSPHTKHRGSTAQWEKEAAAKSCCRCLRLLKNSNPSRQRRTKTCLSSSMVLMMRRIGFGRR